MLILFFIVEETEYEYSGSDEEDENRGDDRESRYFQLINCIEPYILCPRPHFLFHLGHQFHPQRAR